MNDRHITAHWLLLSILILGVGCGAPRTNGEGGCDDDQDCWTQLGDPPADSSWQCVEHQCAARGAGPFEAEAVGEPDDDPAAEPSGPPSPTGQRDVSCSSTSDCFVLGDPPADASWVCTEGRCGLRGAGPFAVEAEPAQEP
ncbi:MAG: hypothetical protein VYE22_01955 [Myxococcota bacterium]|nr:hypothetical protein [Myxococcota bacterium]